MPKKRRTRQHVIAELSANHFERQVLLCGYSVERVEHDYGIDLIIFTYDENSEIENGQIFVQLKATDDISVLSDGQAIAFTLNRSDLELWLREPMPCILVVFDAVNEVAYWIYLQAYFEGLTNFDLEDSRNTVTVHMPRENVVDQSAIIRFSGFKDHVLRQLGGVLHHNE